MKGFKHELSGFHETLLMDDMMQVTGVDLLEAVDVDGGQSYVRRGRIASAAAASPCAAIGSPRIARGSRKSFARIPNSSRR
ncbi:hypothetical protein AUC71_12235 [Methyloceanibacter marginalis]|uniref:Uncharacterized protein n=1 Tax=Methyloceanibacter marginalis TaxID=1774971 RepID=A0A1E3WAZ6_9HYPH|nr:hypothetical protein [Methyloceanibacter marginalis]ODS02983.1 hypothetical protein AUC71_12235 [Methyloceanibacter marginalis]